MDRIDLDALIDEQLELAREARARRSSTAVVGDRTSRLRQHLMVLLEGTELQEHDSPGEATLHVLRGRVVLHAGQDEVELAAGAMAEIPPVRHGVRALEDSACLLTVARERD
ncbi:cupin domain-containing protein [Georgenia sp. Z1491]|uniref:cupin domain-containing protein n=1 Tax=Georgenia sp. Z1491 TaxID=3416707 RepID=UPI003CE6EF9A